MSDLTEGEIFSCMVENFKKAASCCDRLVKLPVMGQAYGELRKSLKLIEGCCRQVGHWREDSRWFPLGIAMEMAHEKAGGWLRGRRPRKLFGMLGDNLRLGANLAEHLRHDKTGIKGAILPPASITSKQHVQSTGMLH
jgi:hypothetical protein